MWWWELGAGNVPGMYITTRLICIIVFSPYSWNHNCFHPVSELEKLRLRKASYLAQGHAGSHQPNLISWTHVCHAPALRCSECWECDPHTVRSAGLGGRSCLSASSTEWQVAFPSWRGVLESARPTPAVSPGPTDLDEPLVPELLPTQTYTVDAAGEPGHGSSPSPLTCQGPPFSVSPPIPGRGPPGAAYLVYNMPTCCQMGSRKVTAYCRTLKWEYVSPTRIIYGLTVNQSLRLRILAPEGCFITLSIKMPCT